MYWIILDHIAALAPLFLVIVTGFYAWKTKGMVEENKKLRDEQYRPRVVVSYKLLRMYEKRARNSVYFVVRNIGITSAFNIIFDIESDLMYSKGKSISQIPLVKDTIPYLAPNEDKKWYLFRIESENEEILYEKRYKETCCGTLTYYDSLEKEYKEKFIIKFTPLKWYIYED